jgi:mannosyltransferase OCH1-like enzyme
MELVQYEPIPKIVHQIWVGSKFDYPKDWTTSWKDDFCVKNGWEYRLWLDKDIEEFKLINQDAYDKAKTGVEKADIARYEIMYAYGGAYVDMDIIYLGNPLEHYLNFNSRMFMAAMESPSLAMNTTIKPPYVANGFFICPKKHRILKKCILKIPERVKMRTSFTFIRTGPSLLNECIEEPIILLPHFWIFPKDFHYQHGITDVSIFKDKALTFTYNVKDYPHNKKLKNLELFGKCTGPDC